MKRLKLSERTKDDLIECLQIAIAHYRGDLGRGLLDEEEKIIQIERAELLIAEIESLETKGQN